MIDTATGMMNLKYMLEWSPHELWSHLTISKQRKNKDFTNSFVRFTVWTFTMTITTRSIVIGIWNNIL